MTTTKIAESTIKDIIMDAVEETLDIEMSLIQKDFKNLESKTNEVSNKLSSLESTIKNTGLSLNDKLSSVTNSGNTFKDSLLKKEKEIASLKSEIEEIKNIPKEVKKDLSLNDIKGLPEALMEVSARPVSQPMTLDVYDGTTLIKSGVTRVNSAGAVYSNGTVTIGGSTSPLTTKGDLYTFDTADTRLPVGADGEVLMADSSTATGLTWKVLNIVGVGTLSTLDYVTVFTPATTPVAGTEFTFIPDVNNPANATLNGVAILEAHGTTLNALEANDMIGGGFYKIRYNGTNYILVGTATTSGIVAWSALTDYNANDVVSHNGMILQRIATGTSFGGFTLPELNTWNVISNYTDIQAWVGGSVYAAGTLVSVPTALGTRILKVTSNILTAATFTNAEAALYTLVSNPLPTTWIANTYMYAGELFYSDNDRVIMRVTDGISGATFDLTESGEYVVIRPSVITAYSPNTFYYYGEEIIQSGVVYRRNLSGTSVGAFNATEKLNWDLVSGHPVSTISANYTVTETDDVLQCDSAGPYTVTIPANRVNTVIRFVRLHPDPLDVVTIATSGAETIVNPSTGVAGASTPIPGIANTNAMINFMLINGVWQAF